MGSYVYYRTHLYLVHQMSWAGGTNTHRIIRGGPDGPVIMAVVLGNGGSVKDIETTAKRIYNKINRIYYFYYPCMIAEEIIWSIIDRKKT